MSGIHAGIQTQHSTAELFVKYPMTNSTTSHMGSFIYNWAMNYKTTIILNGGMHESLRDLLELLEEWEQTARYEVFPFAPFYEPGVNNALTSISIVMDSVAIEFMSRIRSIKPETPEHDTLKLELNDYYGEYGIPVLEAIAFLPLAK
jgi:hypothetical protein